MKVTRSENGSDEIRLWKKVKEGDDIALGRIYTKYIDQLYSYGLKIHDDEAFVKDSIQELFIHLIEKREQITLLSGFQVYLFRSLRNKLLEQLRSENRKKALQEQIDDRDALLVYNVEQAIIVGEEEQRVRSEIQQAFQLLTDHQKELIYLKYSAGMNNREISELLEIDVASIRTLLYRTLKKMRSLLKIAPGN